MVNIYPSEKSDLKQTARQIAESGKGSVCVYINANRASELTYHLIAYGGYAASKQERIQLICYAPTVKTLSGLLAAMGAKTVTAHKFVLCTVTQKQAEGLPESDVCIVYIVRTATNAIERRIGHEVFLFFCLSFGLCFV